LSGQLGRDDAGEVDTDLCSELVRRAEADQAVRRQDPADASLGWQAVAAVDADNLPWLRRLVAERGWPGRSLVGAQGAQAAWLLVQHADADPAFQHRCLDLLVEASGHGEASGTEVAYLMDRVLLAEDQPQEYGTQVTGRDGRWVPRWLREPDTVDVRRAAVSLGPLADYLTAVADQQGPPRPACARCPQCDATIEFWPPDPGQERPIACPDCTWSATVRTEHPTDAGPPDT
jgi:hypothetical protein